MNSEINIISLAAYTEMFIHAKEKAQLLAVDLGNIITTERSCPPTQSLTMTIDETAKLLHLSKPTVYKLASQKDFPSFRVGKKVLVNRNQLQDWMDKQCSKEDIDAEEAS